MSVGGVGYHEARAKQSLFTRKIVDSLLFLVHCSNLACPIEK